MAINGYLTFSSLGKEDAKQLALGVIPKGQPRVQDRQPSHCYPTSFFYHFIQQLIIQKVILLAVHVHSYKASLYVLHENDKP